MIVVPMLPVAIEALKHSGSVMPETFLLTAAVLAVGYGFSSQEPLSWAAYGFIFLACLVYDAAPDLTVPKIWWPRFMKEFGDWITDHLPLSLMLLVSVLHTGERLIWHVVRDQPFPDWRK
jgi:hypothetical protein